MRMREDGVPLSVLTLVKTILIKSRASDRSATSPHESDAWGNAHALILCGSPASARWVLVAFALSRSYNLKAVEMALGEKGLCLEVLLGVVPLCTGQRVRMFPGIVNWAVMRWQCFCHLSWMGCAPVAQPPQVWAG